MTKLVQRLQKTRDSIYRLSDKLGQVGHCDAVFVHRSYGSRLAILPRPRMLELTSEQLYNFQSVGSVEVNSDDRVLTQVSRVGFANFDRITVLGNPIDVGQNPYLPTPLSEPVEAGYLFTVEKPTDISIKVRYDEAEYGRSSFIHIRETGTNALIYSTSYKVEATEKLVYTVTLKPGNYYITTKYNVYLPLATIANVDTVTVDGCTLERSCRVGTVDGVLSVVDSSFIPLSVAWGEDASASYLYNNAICYVNEMPYSIIWVDRNKMHHFTVILRPERVR